LKTAATIHRRARPLLGTLVEVRVAGLAPCRAAQACERAFAEIAAIHRLMSFHDAGSDLDRLHCAPLGSRVRVDERTVAVLSTSLCIAAASSGCFDPTIAAMQVAAGRLPRPRSPWLPDPAANWRDIEIDGGRVRFARPLWIDLGGIAKGYAVDRAIGILIDAGATQACVNAGGDLRVAGPVAEAVHLRGRAGIHAVPRLELKDAAVATSAGSRCPVSAALHIDGRTRRGIGHDEAVSVVAPSCLVADALTKVVLAGSDTFAAALLERFGAQAIRHRSGGGSSSVLGAAA
jgi:thiamine biosynthesis lipoprotein